MNNDQDIAALIAALNEANVNATEAGALSQAQSTALSPELLQQLAVFERSLASPPMQSAQPKWWQDSQVVGLVKLGMICGTVLISAIGVVPVILASMPGNRDAAIVTNAMVALENAAVEAQRPSVTCVSFNCGGFGEAGSAKTQPGTAPVTQPVSNPYYAEAHAKAQQRYATLDASRIDAELMRLESLQGRPMDEQQQAVVAASIDVLRGLK